MLNRTIFCDQKGRKNSTVNENYSSDGVMYDDKSVEAWGETWRSWENDDDDQCALNDETILPESVSWFRWVDKLKGRPDAALPTCTDDQELLSYVPSTSLKGPIFNLHKKGAKELCRFKTFRPVKRHLDLSIRVRFSLESRLFF